jgi:hypothetical protein
MGVDSVWWAWDSQRYNSQRLPQVVLTTGSWIRKGFTCENPSKFFDTVSLYKSS